MKVAQDIAPDVRTEIETRLSRLSGQEGVRLLMAVESGSRGWGFPSPDSDYDVRFVYVRPRSDYLSLGPIRDVIERPIVDDIDLNGWDIRKALGLLLKHNAVLSEWMESPIRYIGEDPAIARLRAMAGRHFNPRGYALHYANLGKGTVARWLGPDGEISVKRYFYALRPALSIRALRIDPWRRPPMEIRPLMAAADLDGCLVEQVEDLIAAKAGIGEAGKTRRLPEIERIVGEELARAGEVPQRADDNDFAEEANALFLQLVEEE